MRPFFLIILASLFMNASTELHQFLRIPLLLEHYRHHRKENSSLSFIDFLKLHYTDRHPDDNDEGEDHELPFKSPESITHTDIPITILKEIAQQPYEQINQLWPGNPASVPDNRGNFIFHPPRSGNHPA